MILVREDYIMKFIYQMQEEWIQQSGKLLLDIQSKEWKAK